MDGRLRDAVFLVERRRRRRQHRRATVAVLVLILALVGIMAWSVSGSSPQRPPMFAARPADTADGRLQPPVTSDGSSDAFAFLQTQDGGDEPVTYDPCTPIHLVVSARTIVDGGMQLLKEALDEISDATGLVFVVDGLSEASLPAPATLTVDDGQRWRPVSVYWSDPQEAKELAGDVAGRGGSTSIIRDGHVWFVTGSVILDGPQLADLMTGEGGRDEVRAVIMHELGHLIGLDHVDEVDQLMHPTGDGSVTTWGEGDLAGLAAVGDGACIDY